MIGKLKAYGEHTHFHRPAPMYWPKDELTFAAAAGAFDTLLYTKPPPASLGLATARCIGEVCVAQRAGSCRTVPVTPRLLPDPLIELAGR
jgi:hypothetical protein